MPQRCLARWLCTRADIEVQGCSDSMPDLVSASSSDEEMSEPDQDDNQTFEEWAKTVEEEKKVAEPVRIQPASETARVLIAQISRDIQNNLNRRVGSGEKKSHFRKLQRLYHPDKAEDREVGTIVFQWLADQELRYLDGAYVQKNTGGNVVETRPDPGGWRNNIAVDQEGNPLDSPPPPPPAPSFHQARRLQARLQDVLRKEVGRLIRRLLLLGQPGSSWCIHLSGPDRFKQPPPCTPLRPQGSSPPAAPRPPVFSPPVFAPPSFSA